MSRKKTTKMLPCEVCGKDGNTCGIEGCSTVICPGHGVLQLLSATVVGYICVPHYRAARDAKYPGPDYWLITSESGDYGDYRMYIVGLESNLVRALQAAVAHLLGHEHNPYLGQEEKEIRPLLMHDSPMGAFSLCRGYGSYDLQLSIFPIRIGEMEI